MEILVCVVYPQAFLPVDAQAVARLCVISNVDEVSFYLYSLQAEIVHVRFDGMEAEALFRGLDARDVPDNQVKVEGVVVVGLVA